MKTLLRIVALISLFCLSCAERDTRDVTAPLVRAPDLVFEEDGVIAHFYDTSNPFTETMLRTTTTVPVVIDAMLRFEAVGYQYRAEHSFVVEGRTGDDRNVMMSVLALANVLDEANDAISLVCAREDKRWRVVPLRVTRDGAQSSMRDSANGSAPDTDVIVEVLEPVGSVYASAPGQPAFGWKRWGQCVTKRVAGATVGCLISCRWVPMVYLKCLAICTGAQAASALISCTISEL